jgi:hypothetical protein
MVMNLAIRRLSAERDFGQRYHLFDGKGKLTLVADYASPWLPDDERHRVRFARSGGQVVASLDLPEREGRVRNGRSHTSYALILDHAVYAILNKYQEENRDKPPFFTIEADGLTWLAWHEPDGDSLLTFFSDVPPGLMLVNDPQDLTPYDPAGAVNQAAGEYDFMVTLLDNPLHHAELILLALIFLVDRA